MEYVYILILTLLMFTDWNIPSDIYSSRKLLLKRISSWLTWVNVPLRIRTVLTVSLRLFYSLSPPAASPPVGVDTVMAPICLKLAYLSLNNKRRYSAIRMYSDPFTSLSLDRFAKKIWYSVYTLTLWCIECRLMRKHMNLNNFRESLRSLNTFWCTAILYWSYWGASSAAPFIFFVLI